MTFKRMMVLGAAAAALVFTGCRDQSRGQGYQGTATDQTQPATGGSGTANGNAIPGSSNTIGGTPQTAQPGTELGGTGSENENELDQSGTGGSGMKTGSKRAPRSPRDAGMPGGSDAGM